MPSTIESPRHAFGLLLREWRDLRRKSQMAVALEAGVSPRHLSFVESGRSTPSRAMVLTLAGALDVPLRERNALLAAAGYAPMFPEGGLESPELAQVRRALEQLLEHQEPYPAVVLDRQWNILQTNRAAPRLFGRFVDLDSLPQPRNLLRTIFDPSGLRPWIANWEEVSTTLIQRVFREAVAGIPDRRTVALLEELRSHSGPDASRPLAPSSSLPFHPVEFARGDLRLAFFSMVTTVGAPFDVTAQELRIEAFFPADEKTERFARDQLA